MVDITQNIYRKKFERNESNLLHAWLWEKHRQNIQWRRVRLGVLPTVEMARAYLTTLRWADAIVIQNGTVYIIEAKIRPEPGVISQLELYDMLFKQTPEFEAYKDWHVEKVILSSVLDLNMVELASSKGILFELFTFEDVNKARQAMLLPPV